MTARKRARTGRPVARPAQTRRRHLRAWTVGGAVAVVVMVLLVGVTLNRGGSGTTVATTPPAAGANNVAPGAALSELRTPDFHSMAINPGDPNIVLYGHHGGVLRSTDGGRSWAKTDLTGDTDDAMGMGISTGDTNLAFAAGHGTFFRSTDGGQTWTSPKPPLPSTDIHGMAVSPDASPVLHAHVVGQGLFRSEDAGQTWKKTSGQVFPGDVMQVAASTGGRVYLASMGGGMLRSDDSGTTFKPTGKLAGSLLSVATQGDHPDIVYAGTESTLSVSRDGGATWSALPLPTTGQVLVIAANPRDANDVMVVVVGGDRVGRVYRSRDGGASWKTN